MLLFRWEEPQHHIHRWCQQWNLPPGHVLSLEQGWQLASRWYSDRMRADYQRPTKDQAQELFSSLGLQGEFWKF